jgi:hypothetical protein
MRLSALCVCFGDAGKSEEADARPISPYFEASKEASPASILRYGLLGTWNQARELVAVYLTGPLASQILQ